MKSHVKASPQRSCLATRSCWRFSPTSVDPGLGQRAHLLQRHVLARDEDLDLGPATARGPRSRLARDPRRRRCRGSGSGTIRLRQLEPGEPGLAAGAARVAAVGEEELRLAAGAEAGDLDPLDARPRASSAARDLGAGRACARRRSPRRGRRRRRGPPRRPRSSRGRSRGRSPRRVAPTASAPRGDDPGREPAPAAVQHRHAAGPGERDRQAVGDEDQRRQARARRSTCPSTSASSRAGFGEGARLLGAAWTRDLGAVDLAADQDPLRVEPERGGEPPPVLEHRGRLVVGEHAEVEALERRAADAAEPGRERGPRRRGSSASSQRTPSLLAPVHRR